MIFSLIMPTFFNYLIYERADLNLDKTEIKKKDPFVVVVFFISTPPTVYYDVTKIKTKHVWFSSQPLSAQLNRN